jgi:D-glycero-D-manno-heptose 1,7-bisphosphate phosphatase
VAKRIITRSRSLALAIAAAVFGGFYTLLSDLTDALPTISNLPTPLRISVRLLVATAVTTIAYSLAVWAPRVRSRHARNLGFQRVSASWFPAGMDGRIEAGREVLDALTHPRSWPLILLSVTGEWDIMRPYGEKELRALLGDAEAELRVLLSHPDSVGLARRCAKEKLDLFSMKRRIVHTTEYLLAASPSRVHVRWTYEPPTFHILANPQQLHFSPFVDGLAGHDTPRYVVSSDSPLFASFSRYFATRWHTALAAQPELGWVKKGAFPRAAVFLDRDNTLIRDMAYSSTQRASELSILPGVVEGLRLLRDAGFRLIVVSNQHPVGMGITSEEQLIVVSKTLKQALAAEGVRLDAFYYCTHGENDGCNCRKPGPGLFEQAARDLPIDFQRSFFIGDSDADAGVVQYLPGLQFLRVGNGKGFLTAAREIMERLAVV